ncbi:YkvI family membrane protein [Desulfovirgula thermocuniculi]|uniref:YkvI family membrane protein n=1 Tax=Desulfovirgula thermocuniculi TaxID=348842 RepID=UPI0003FF11E4|nr:hypothetical protein [Desulfovirgula thermocuniculi]
MPCGRWVKESFQVAVLYVGAVIGAGFASGQEILQFFMVFGYRGLWGAALVTFLFALLGFSLMLSVGAHRTTSYGELLPWLLGRRLAGFMDYLNLLMLFGGLAVMLAGGGALATEQLGLPGACGVIFTAAVTSLVILGGLEGVILANALLVPLKVAFIAFVCLAALWRCGAWPDLTGGPFPLNPPCRHWALSGLLYVSYNMVVPVAVLSSLGGRVSPGAGVAGGAAGGAALGAAVFLVALAELAFFPGVLRQQVPLLVVAASLGEVWKHCLGVLVWLAILTTAIADAHGLASRLAPRGGRAYRRAGVLAVLACLPLARADFSRLVQLLYPLFGCAGLLLTAALAVAPLRLARAAKK